jgi:hypothetical protein
MTFQERINRLIDEAIAQAADGLSWAELWTLLLALVGALMDLAEELQDGGASKKKVVLAAIEVFVDRLLLLTAARPILPLPWYLELVRPAIRGLIKQFVMVGADGILEGLFNRDWA